MSELRPSRRPDPNWATQPDEGGKEQDRRFFRRMLLFVGIIALIALGAALRFVARGGSEYAGLTTIFSTIPWIFGAIVILTFFTKGSIFRKWMKEDLKVVIAVIAVLLVVTILFLLIWPPEPNPTMLRP